MRAHDTHLARHADRVVTACLGAVEAAAFWAAALFPVVHLSFLVAVGAGDAPLTLLPWLVTGHAVAIVAGHRHEPAERRATDDEHPGVGA